jgi:hypothetical protein
LADPVPGVELGNPSGVSPTSPVASIDQMLTSRSHFRFSWSEPWRSGLSIDRRFQGSDNSHACEQHGSAVFSGIDEHLDGQPPFLTITFWLRKLPDVVGGVSQGLRRRSFR